MPNNTAPAGQVWVCPACGRRARDRVEGGISRGWDSSCYSHAVLCWEASVKFEDDVLICAEAVDGENAEIMR